MKNQFKAMQGDVQLFSINSLPKNAIKVKNRPVAYGEISGHCHIVTGDVELFEIEGRTFAVVGNDGARLQHIHESKITTKAWVQLEEIEIADHQSIPLKQGIYEMTIQNQFNPYSKLMEKVID